MENWKFAFSSILSHKMRTFLTMLGIIIGVCSVVVILALGTGLRDSLSNELTSTYRNLRIYYKTRDYKDKEKTKALEGIISEPLKEPTEPIVTDKMLKVVGKDISGVTYLMLEV